MKTAAKIPLNADRVARKQKLTERFERIFTLILALLEEREDKAANPMIRVQSLIREVLKQRLNTRFSMGR